MPVYHHYLCPISGTTLANQLMCFVPSILSNSWFAKIRKLFMRQHGGFLFLQNFFSSRSMSRHFDTPPSMWLLKTNDRPNTRRWVKISKIAIGLSPYAKKHNLFWPDFPKSHFFVNQGDAIWWDLVKISRRFSWVQREVVAGNSNWEENSICADQKIN